MTSQSDRFVLSCVNLKGSTLNSTLQSLALATPGSDVGIQASLEPVSGQLSRSDSRALQASFLDLGVVQTSFCWLDCQYPTKHLPTLCTDLVGMLQF